MTATTPLEYSRRSALVDTNFVCFVRGCDAERVAALVDAGNLIWVWDIAENRKNRPGRAATRELRFWVNEVLAPQMTARLTIDELVEKLLPASRSCFGTAEVRHLFLVSRPKAVRMCHQMNTALTKRSVKVTRPTLADYLRRTWIGGGQS